jgi:hypothetical protein
MSVMIGIDPHKATHTAVAIDEREVVLDECKVRASKTQARRLCDWAVVNPPGFGGGSRSLIKDESYGCSGPFGEEEDFTPVQQ